MSESTPESSAPEAEAAVEPTPTDASPPTASPTEPTATEPTSVSAPVPKAERIDPKRVVGMVVLTLTGATLLFLSRQPPAPPVSSTSAVDEPGRSYLERPPGELPEDPTGLLDFGFERQWGTELETDDLPDPFAEPYREPTARDSRLETGLGLGQQGPTPAELEAERRRQILRRVGQASMRSGSEEDRSSLGHSPQPPNGGLEGRFAALEAQLDRELAALESSQLGGLGGLTGSGPVSPFANTTVRPDPKPGTLDEPRSRIVPPQSIPAGVGFRVQLAQDVDTERQTLILGEVLDTVRSLDGVVRLRPGDRLLGRSENALQAGERRLLWSWNEVHRHRPQGLVVTTVPALEVSDLRGASGVRGELDRHLGARYGSAVLLSLISAGFALGESAELDGTLDRRDVAVSTGAEELRSITTEILRRNLAIAPTLRLRRGTVLQVILHRDLRL